MSSRLLITGARAPVSLDLARSARSAGYAAQLADSIPSYAARGAKLGPVMELPRPRFQFSAFAERLSEYCQTYPDALIIPTCEEVFFVSAAAARHGFGEQALVSDLGTLRSLHSKIEFPALLQSLGIRAPETTIIDEPVRTENCRDAVLKPEFSRFGSATLIRPDARECARIKPSKDHRWAMQEFIAGEEFCLWSAARDGVLTASAVYHPKWRHGQTAAYAFEAVDAPEAVDIAARLADALDYTGQIGLDLIRTENGEFVPVECNPRSVSGLHLFDCSPDLARALTGDGPAMHVTRGLRYLAPAMWAMGLPKSLMHGRYRQWRADMRSGRDVLSRDGNGWPIAGAMLDALRFAAIGVTRMRSAAGQTTDDIEWNGEPIS
ncbi:MAG: hypothetical protein AAF250_14270 [Pseudomonadota bacterium]